MNEIEKLMQNAEVTPICLIPDRYCGMQPIYEDLTPEKQLELIKWLSQHTYRNYIKFRFDICGFWYCECNMSNSDMHHTFEEALAETINNLWQDLTDKEKEQIRNILNGY